MSDPVRIGNATLYLGDCRDLFPALALMDALVTDPPYGIGMDGGKVGKSEYAQMDWDGATNPEAIQQAQAITHYHIIFGGNYYPLPPSGHWLVWDKQNDPTTFADFEMAWTNLGKASRMIRHLWSGPYQKVRETRFHPTQKPLAVMEWAIQQLPDDCMTVFDPFAGSGTTGVACAHLGRQFIGIEKVPAYFEIMRRRIEEAQRQADLFIPMTQQEKATDSLRNYDLALEEMQKR